MTRNFNLKSTGAKASNAGKVAGSALISLAAFEALLGGAQAAEADIKAGVSLAKYAVSPDVYKVKKGLFGKTKKVNINPVTGKMKADKTGKAPVNKKAFRV